MSDATTPVIRTVIVDDEAPARRRLRRMLDAMADVEVVGEASDGADAVRLLESERPDLCLLDVEMPGGDGFQVLRRSSHTPQVIFVTAYDHYAVKAFEVHSLDYVLKPVTRARLEAAVDRARQALRAARGPSEAIEGLLEQLRTGLPPVKSLADRRSPGAPPRIAAKRGSRVVLLEPREVLCFVVEDALVFACTAGGRYMVDRGIGELEADLGPRFFRSHRACLVNLDRVREIQPAESGTYWIRFDEPQDFRVPLSRRQARRLREILPW